jgi:predicted amidohydrolase YtcJ
MKQLLSAAVLSLLFSLSSCIKGEAVDLIIHNAQIHTLTEMDEVMEAIAIKDGKIVEVGPERQILNKYSAKEYIDAELKDMYPGFTDAHAHLLNYARLKLSVDLVGCRSYEEMIERIKAYQQEHDHGFIIGRGWDQSIWPEGEMPSNKLLSETFPDLPVCLFRIDGHALLTNDLMIDSSEVYSQRVDILLKIKRETTQVFLSTMP